MSLTTNNDELFSILSTIEALPEAGSGSSGMETCTVGISSASYDSSSMLFEVIYLTVDNGAVSCATGSVQADGYSSFTILKNSLITCQFPPLGGAGSFDEVTVNEGDSELAYLNEESHAVIHIGTNDEHDITVYTLANI